jgi:uncharacterized protein (UPF0276 family)
MILAADKLGVGLGYRPELHDDFEHHCGDIDFFEFIGDNCFDAPFLHEIERWSYRLPSVCHSVGLSLGTAEPLDEVYVAKLESILQRIRPHWLSDHIAVTSVQGLDLGHLSPVLFTEETVEIVSTKVATLQKRFGIPLLLENITYHFTLPGAQLTEWELITRLTNSADCGILLDLSNLYINAHNNRYDPYEFLRGIPLDRVMQVHLGGATETEGVLIDSHGGPVHDEAFEFLEYVCRVRPVPAISFERDKNMPPFEDLAREMHRAREIWHGRTRIS